MLQAEQNTIHIAVVRGEITATVANSMITHQGTVQRDMVDDFMLRTAMLYLGDAAHGYAEGYVRYYSPRFMTDPAGLDGIAESVARELRAAADGYGDLNRAEGRERLREFVHAVVRTDSKVDSELSNYEAALLIWTRVHANRVLDNVVHPYVGATRVPWTGVKYADSPIWQKMDSLFVGLTEATENWRDADIESRGAVEAAIIDVLRPLAWAV